MEQFWSNGPILHIEGSKFVAQCNLYESRSDCGWRSDYVTVVKFHYHDRSASMKWLDHNEKSSKPFRGTLYLKFQLCSSIGCKVVETKKRKISKKAQKLT